MVSGFPGRAVSTRYHDSHVGNSHRSPDGFRPGQPRESTRTGAGRLSRPTSPGRLSVPTGFFSGSYRMTWKWLAKS